MITEFNKVIHSDCIEGMQSLPSGCVDLILTDPPYKIQDMLPYFIEFKRVLKSSGSIYVFGDKNVIAEYWFQQFPFTYKELLIWHYRNSPKPKGRWRMSMQAIIYGYSSVELSTFNEDEARIEYQPNTKKLNGRLRPSSGRLKKCSPYDMSRGALPRDVIEHPALLGHLSKERVGHRDQKPLGLFERLIRTSSNVNDIVLDPFAGSGTTVIGCLNTGRKYIAFEKSSEWFQKITSEILTTG